MVLVFLRPHFAIKISSFMEYPFQEKGFTMSKLSDKIQKKVDQFLD